LKIKAIRSDNGGEYINAAVQKFTDDMGIDPQHSAPYMPQSNGSPKNNYQKLQAKATALILHSGMDPNIWSEAVKTANYI
jgi:transposase InsO family protein